jgi:hypothetical protein
LFSLAHPRIVVALAAGICLAGAIAVTSACLTDPPPDLPSGSNQGPEIITDALVPPGEFTVWPGDGTFKVFVRNVDPNKCLYSVTMDGVLKVPCQRCGQVVSNGVVEIDLFGLPILDPLTCSQPITVYVATGFIGSQCTAYDDGQGDTATWLYSPLTCLVYDAGSVQNGAFPEGSPDGLLVVPESGVE